MLRRGLILGLGLGAAALLTATSAQAYWSSSASGSGAAQSGNLTAPVASATAPAPGTVTLTWSASSGTAAPIGYYVVRTNSSSVAAPACGTSPSATISTLTCTESGITAGTYTYTVTAVSLSWTATSAQVAVTVTAAGASKLVFTTQPSNSTGGIAFPSQPAVAIQDSTGNVVVSNTSAVNLAIQTPAGATLSCALNPRPAVAGIATFTGCAIDKPGTYTLIATDGALAAATSAAFTITVGPAAKLAFTASPSGSFMGWAFYTQPVVTIQDAGGNTVAANTSAVTLAITTAQGAKLSCTNNPQSASSGVATFTGCLIDKKTGTYTLTATDGSLTSAISAAFTVSDAPTNLAWLANTTTVCKTQSGTQFALTYNGCSLLLGIGPGSFTSKVLLTDASGNPVINLGADLTVTLTPVSGSASPTTLTIAHGLSDSVATVTFRPGYTVLGPFTDTLTASAPAVTSATARLNA